MFRSLGADTIGMSTVVETIAARLAPCKDDNAVLRKIDRKDWLLSIRY